MLRLYTSFVRLDALVHQVKNVARMPDGETKEQLKEVAVEILREYVEAGAITDEARQMLMNLLND
jgi:hypothetical protein